MLAQQRQETPRVAAIYCRVSGAGQEENASLPTQEAACRAHAVARGYAVEEAFVVREVHTAAELWQRPLLAGLRDAIRQGQVGALVCHSLDRLSRKQTHLAILVDECERAGVELLFVTEEFERSAVGDFIRSAKAFAAELEREKIAERMRRGLLGRVHAGRPIPGSRPLYGYRWRDDAKSGLDVDEATAPVVRRIFAAILDGRTLRGIATDLTADGIPTPTGQAAWKQSSVHVIAANRAYTGHAEALRHATGKVAGGGRRLLPPEEQGRVALPAGTIPPLIDAATFAEVAARLARNKATAAGRLREPEAFLLRGGYVRCGYCGRAVSCAWRQKRRADGTTALAAIYRLGDRADSHRDCQSVVITAAQLDGAVWGHVEALLTRPEIIAGELARLRRDDTTATDLAASEPRAEAAGPGRARGAREALPAWPHAALRDHRVDPARRCAVRDGADNPRASVSGALASRRHHTSARTVIP